MSRTDGRNLLFYSVILAALAGSLLVFWYRWPILYPYSYFEYRSTYGGFTVYSDSTIDPQFGEIIGEVRRRMNRVEGYDPGISYPLFICHRQRCYERFARQMGVSIFSQGLTMEPMGYAVVNLEAIAVIDNARTRPYPYTLAQGDPAHIIAHELVHLVATSRLGIWKTVMLPEWKEEGYAEYAASLYLRQIDPGYSLPDRIRQYLDGYYREVGPTRLKYIRAGLAVEYLLDVRRLGFETVMDRSFDFDDLLQEMEDWGRSEAKE